VHSEYYFEPEAGWWANTMLAVGIMPATRGGGAGGRLKYQEIYSYLSGEGVEQPGCLNLDVFLPLQERLSSL